MGLGHIGRIGLHLLGTWRVDVSGAEGRVKALKHRALLSFLALQSGTPVHRDEVAMLFWPSPDRKKSRASLRQSLSTLTRDLPDAPIQSDGQYLAVPPDLIRTDLDQLRANLNAGRLTHATLSALRSTPDLLRGFDDISPEFDEWLRDTRAAVLTEVVTSAEQLLEDASHSPSEHLALARALLELDDLNETAARAKIAALAAMNDNSAALRAYNTFYRRMEDELGVEPSIETQELAVRIKLTAAVADAEPAEPARMQTLVAVLPFERLGPTDIPDYTILGMLDQITCRMAAFQAPPVISSNSTRQFLNKPPGVAELKASMGATYVVSGTVQVSGNQALVSVQLSETTTESVVWADSRDVPVTRLFDASTRFATDIAQMIEPSLNLAELDRVKSLPTEDWEPHHHVLRAKDLMFRLNIADFAEAKASLDIALDLAPRFGPAHALAAEWHGIDLWQGWSNDPATSRTALERHSQMAIRLFPSNGRALAQWGHHKITLHRDFDAALALFDRALESWPNDSETLIWTVPTLAHAGYSGQAVENGEKAFRLSPFDPFLHRNEHFLSLAHYASGDFDESARLGLSCYAGRPTYGSNMRVTIAALVGAGRLDEARALAAQHAQAEPGFSLTKVKGRMGFRSDPEQARYVSHLIAAGLPA